MTDTANTATANAAPIVAPATANVTVSDTGAVTTSFEAAPSIMAVDAPPPAANAEANTTTVVTATDVTPTATEINKNLATWLSASESLVGSIVGAAAAGISELIGSIPDSDEVKSKRDAIALIKKTRKVDDVRAEQIYNQYLRDQQTATPKDEVLASLGNKEV